MAGSSTITDRASTTRGEPRPRGADARARRRGYPIAFVAVGLRLHDIGLVA